MRDFSISFSHFERSWNAKNLAQENLGSSRPTT
jgi:hypothetical protein